MKKLVNLIYYLQECGICIFIGCVSYLVTSSFIMMILVIIFGAFLLNSRDNIIMARGAAMCKKDAEQIRESINILKDCDNQNEELREELREELEKAKKIYAELEEEKKNRGL